MFQGAVSDGLYTCKLRVLTRLNHRFACLDRCASVVPRSANKGLG